MTSINQCLCCGSKNLKVVFEFPNCPLSDAYQDNKSLSLQAKLHPCILSICLECSHSQLSHHIEQEEIYSSYNYQSQVTLGLNKNFDEYAQQLSNEVNSNKPITLLDVGSNDGSFLYACLKHNIQAYGIEPSVTLAKTANVNNLPTHNGFFLGKKNQELPPHFPIKYDIITFNNVLANLSNPKEILSSAKELLQSDDSLIVIQTGYHPTQFSKGLIDYVYHEHYSYFTVKSTNSLARQCGLKVVKVQLSNLRGGSMRIFLKKSNSFEYFPGFEYERFDNPYEFVGIQYLIQASKKYIHGLLQEKKEANTKIVGFGASHSTGMLVHLFDLQDKLDLIVDENPRKHHLYMPGTSYKVQDPNHVNLQDCLIIVLAWQYYSEIKNKLVLKGVPSENIIKPILP